MKSATELSRYTTYTDYEDTKRLAFITDLIADCTPDHGRVLDVGCGNGNVSKAIGGLGFKVLGIDINEQSVHQANLTNPFPNSVTFRCLQIEEVDALDEKFQVIVCSEVLEHLHRPDLLVARFRDWLADDGLLIVTVPNGWGPRELLVTRPVQLIEKTPLKRVLIRLKQLLGYRNSTLQSNNPDLTHIHFFTFQALRRMMTNAGFRLVKTGKANFVEKVFPFSLYYKHHPARQAQDARLADRLPVPLSSGFYTAYQKV